MDVKCQLAAISFGIWFTLVSPTALFIDNEVLGEPSIDCEVDSIIATFRTRRPFYGRLFVKGHSSNAHCLLDFSTRSFGSAHDYNATIRIQYGTCDVRRERSVTPRGVHMYSILVIQLACFYKEAVQTVSNQLDVSTLTMDNLVGTFKMPVCSYSLRQNSSNGPFVRYAKVGDRVVHRWECQSPGIESKDNPYGMLVHSCVVDDGRGSAVAVVDEHGCAIDPYILGHVSYDENLLLAYREAHIFKFADQNALAFSCQIRLCVKGADACVGMTPPKCLPLKNKRSAPNHEDAPDTLHRAEESSRGRYVDVPFEVHNWTVLFGTTEFTAQKEACFSYNDGCYRCRYSARSSQFVQNAAGGIRVSHRWTCNATDMSVAQPFSLMLHSCYTSTSTSSEQLTCENSLPELHSLTYSAGNVVMGDGEIVHPSLTQSMVCQLRICEGVQCQRKKCNKRQQRSSRRWMNSVDQNEDVDVATDQMIVFDTDDDLAGLSLSDTGDQSKAFLCVQNISAATFLGCTILLIVIMIASCSTLVWSVWRQKEGSCWNRQLKAPVSRSSQQYMTMSQLFENPSIWHSNGKE